MAQVAREACPDHTAWDVSCKYFDARSTPEKPLWFMVDIRFVEKFRDPFPLTLLRSVSGLENMLLLKKAPAYQSCRSAKMNLLVSSNWPEAVFCALMSEAATVSVFRNYTVLRWSAYARRVFAGRQLPQIGRAHV